MLNNDQVLNLMEQGDDPAAPWLAQVLRTRRKQLAAEGTQWADDALASWLGGLGELQLDENRKGFLSTVESRVALAMHDHVLDEHERLQRQHVDFIAFEMGGPGLRINNDAVRQSFGHNVGSLSYSVVKQRGRSVLRYDLLVC